ncbi:uncharacterized protein FOMMEDRAFT_164145 [Fomitiporia mediterranea MF3/22]|uniref:Uncharacterized protein n=1 Tax=Fomitiporia mediterranea (strain MF3/22) TaxID=694068 RepID=R7SF06_FOMME|nr:uncharacterized protein FOMMEDRAFT_164145 [Fomitiporia mediterranea MF3/22]EJC97278.1 hypothetical protein FOMMEDRAFT_164145 [Fomitiporia mediterranea MF3/22]
MSHQSQHSHFPIRKDPDGKNRALSQNTSWKVLQFSTLVPSVPRVPHPSIPELRTSIP